MMKYSALVIALAAITGCGQVPEKTTPTESPVPKVQELQEAEHRYTVKVGRTNEELEEARRLAKESRERLDKLEKERAEERRLTEKAIEERARQAKERELLEARAQRIKALERQLADAHREVKDLAAQREAAGRRLLNLEESTTKPMYSDTRARLHTRIKNTRLEVEALHQRYESAKKEEQLAKERLDHELHQLPQ